MFLQIKKIFILLAILTILVSCSPDPKQATFTIASWNLYCFFDGREDGTEYEGFRHSSGYTQEKYLERVRATSRYMVERMGDADLLILEEVEDAGVLKDLLENGLQNIGFRWFGLAQNQNGMLSVGFLSKVEPTDVNVHGVEGERLVLDLEFVLRGETVRVFGVHGRSQVSDEDGFVRKEEFTLLKTLAGETDSLVVLCGDFNADPSAGGIEMGLVREFHDRTVPLLITGDGGSTKDGIFYSPFFDYGAKVEANGSYFYGGTWSFLDNFLLNGRCFDGQGLEYDSASVIHPSEATDYSGRPSRYEVSTGKGYSDHFAIKLVLRYT